MIAHNAIKSTDGTIEFNNTSIIDMPRYCVQVNSGTNLQLGSCAAAELNFSVQDLSMQIPQISDKEFTYEVGKLSAYTFTDGSELTFRDGDIYYFIDELTTVGYFTPTKIERVNDVRWNITMLDRLSRFDVDATKWATSLPAKQTLGQIFKSLCNFVGVEYATAEFPNSDYVVGKNFTADNLTARTILTWIGEASARFFYMTPEGKLSPGWYKQTSKVIENRNTIDLKISDYETAPITKVAVSTSTDENAIDVIVGEGTNSYNIKDNPFLYADSDAKLRPAVENIFNVLNGFKYTPATATVLDSVLVDPGDIFLIKSYRENDASSIAMKIIYTSLQKQIESTGDQILSTKTSVNKVIKKLEARTNTIIATMDEFSVTLQGLENNTEAQFKILKNQISSKVSQTDYNGNEIASLINQTATTVEISASKIDLSGDLKLRGLFKSVTPGTGVTTLVNNGKITFYPNESSADAETGAWSSIQATSSELSWSTLGRNCKIYCDNGNMEVYSNGGWFNMYGNVRVNNLSASNQSRLVMANPATASGGFEARWVERSDLGGFSLGRLTSARKYKKDIHELDTGELLEKALKVTPISFRYKDDDRLINWGMLADDFINIFPELTVVNDQGEPESIQYSTCAPIFFGAIQELYKMIMEVKSNGTNKATV